MSSNEYPTFPQSEPDHLLELSVFVIAFFVVAVVFALLNSLFVSAYDLRLVGVMLGGLAGWLALRHYRARKEGKGVGDGQGEHNDFGESGPDRNR